MLPGPTYVPDSIMNAMLISNIYHRSEQFHALYRELEADLQDLFRTKRDVYMVSSSGTGGLEAVISNTVRKGDKMIVVVNGYFSGELGSLIEAFGGVPIRLEVGWNEAVDISRVEDLLKRHPDVKAVCAAYVETSTGARVPLEELSALCNRYGKFLITDAESAIAGEEFMMDDWNVGAVVAGTQKCIAGPPGLALVCLGEAALNVIEKNGSTGFYFDLKRYADYSKKGETPFTPALPQLFALRASLSLIKAEGLDSYIARQKMCSDLLKEGLRGMGLNAYLPATAASNVATAVDISSSGLSAPEIVKRLYDDHRVAIATGLGAVKEKVIRVGTMGFVKQEDVRATIDALRDVVK